MNKLSKIFKKLISLANFEAFEEIWLAFNGVRRRSNLKTDLYGSLSLLVNILLSIVNIIHINTCDEPMDPPLMVTVWEIIYILLVTIMNATFLEYKQNSRDIWRNLQPDQCSKVIQMKLVFTVVFFSSSLNAAIEVLPSRQNWLTSEAS